MFYNTAIHIINRICNCKNIEQALYEAGRYFPSIPSELIISLYNKEIDVTFSDDGNTVYFPEEV
jgi:hypothetical protein